MCDKSNRCIWSVWVGNLLETNLLNAFSDALFLQVLGSYNWSILEHFLDILVLGNTCSFKFVVEGSVSFTLQ